MNSDLASRLPRGRPKGAVNKVSGDIREMIMSALQRVGGRGYLERLATQNPAIFAKLLGLVIPRQIAHSGVITGVTVQIQTNLALPGRALKQIETQMQQEDLIPPIPQKVDEKDP